MAQVVTRTRADGGSSYQVRWQLGGSRAGAWQAETFTTDVRARAFKLDVEEAGHFWPKGWIRGEGYIQKSTNEKRFADVAKDYFAEQDRRIKRGRIKAYTVHRYLRTHELHLQPAFGDKAFSEVEPGDIADWIDDEIESGSSPKSVQNRHGLLFSVMSHGQKRMRLRPDNPCEVTELPEDNARDARQVRFFLHGEWALFRACLKQDVHLLVDVLLATGIRWGEISALRVSDVAFQDDGAAVMHIARAWSKRAPEDEHEVRASEGEAPSWILGPPKNKRARYVVASGEVAQRLRDAVGSRGPSEYVFQTRYGNPWRYQDFHSDRWIPARNDAVKRALRS